MKNKKKMKPGRFTRRAAAGAFAVLMAVSLAACASGGSKARTGSAASSDTESIDPDNYTAIFTIPRGKPRGLWWQLLNKRLLLQPVSEATRHS